MKKKSITTQEFDKLFDQDKDVTEFLDLETAKRQGMETRRVSVDFRSGWSVCWIIRPQNSV